MKTYVKGMSLFGLVFFIMVLLFPAQAKSRQITAGVIVDLTGPLAMNGQPMYLGVKDSFQDANDRNAVPGIEFNSVVYDTKYDAAKTAPAYHYCKGKGAQIMMPIYLQDVEAVKPLAEEDEIPVVGYNSSHLTIKLPSWVFTQTPLVEDFASSSIKWIVSNWDYKKEGRPPNIAAIGWDNALGNTYTQGAEDFAQSPQVKGKVNWVGKIIVPPRTVDYMEPARSLDEWKTDWLAVGCVPSGTIPLMKLRQSHNYKYKMIWGDWGQVIWGFVKERAGDAVVGHYWITTFGWWGQPEPGVKRTEKALEKYRSEEEIKKLRIKEGYEYLTGFGFGCAVIEAVKKAAAKVGPNKVDGKAIYEALQNLYVDTQGILSPMTWTKTKRTGSDLVRAYEVMPDLKPAPISDWFPLVRK